MKSLFISNTSIKKITINYSIYQDAFPFLTKHSSIALCYLFGKHCKTSCISRISNKIFSLEDSPVHIFQRSNVLYRMKMTNPTKNMADPTSKTKNQKLAIIKLVQTSEKRLPCDHKLHYLVNKSSSWVTYKMQKSRSHHSLVVAIYEKIKGTTQF